MERLLERHSPVLHMQFDEMASNALHNSFKAEFKKQGQIQRRNPLKYMNNPNIVKSIVAGSKQFTYQEKFSGRMPQIESMKRLS